MKSSTRSKFLFIFLSLFHLIVALINSDSRDWRIQWYASLDIRNGIPMYELTPRVINGIWIDIPFHFPVFFYVLAALIVIFGPFQVIGRVFLWINTVILGIITIKLIQPNNDREFQLITMFYFLNPILIGISYFKLFDQFTLLLLFLGILLFKNNRYYLFGFLIGLGTMTKFFPIFAMVPITIYFIKYKNYKKLLISQLGFVSSSFSIFLYFYIIYSNEFLERTIIWQYTRDHSSLSILNFEIFNDLPSFYIPAIQIIILLLYFIIIYKLPINLDYQNIISHVALILSAFLLTLKTVYPQYGLWYTLPMISSFLIFYRRKQYTNVMIVLFDIIIFSLGSLLWILQEINDAFSSNIFKILGSILFLISVIIVIPIVYKSSILFNM